MERLEERNRPGFGYQLKVHTFRTLTAVLAWALVVAAFYQKPELLTSAQQLMQRGIEAAGRRCRSIAVGARMDCISRTRWLDLAPDHSADTRRSHGALDDRGGVAAHLPKDRPKAI